MLADPARLCIASSLERFEHASDLVIPATCNLNFEFGTQITKFQGDRASLAAALHGPCISLSEPTKYRV
jgi:hypothetical protein